MRRSIAILALVGGAALMLPAFTQADHGGLHMYCDEENQPVVTDYGPYTEDDPEWTFECLPGGTPIVVHRVEPLPAVDPTEEQYERPDDWFRWVGIDLNGTPVVNPYPDESRPYLVRGTNRVVIPIRIFSEAIGAEVKWHPQNQEVVINWKGMRITLRVGSTLARVNGQAITLDQPAVIWNDRTYIPLRFVAEAFGATVDWDNDSGVVELTMPGVKCVRRFCPFADEEAVVDETLP